MRWILVSVALKSDTFFYAQCIYFRSKLLLEFSTILKNFRLYEIYCFLTNVSKQIYKIQIKSSTDLYNTHLSALIIMHHSNHVTY